MARLWNYLYLIVYRTSANFIILFRIIVYIDRGNVFVFQNVQIRTLYARNCSSREKQNVSYRFRKLLSYRYTYEYFARYNTDNGKY